MSYEMGMQAMRLQCPARLAHTEYVSNYALVRAVTGLDPRTDERAWSVFDDAWQLDFLWVTNDGPVDWPLRGRVTDMGHAEYAAGGVDREGAEARHRLHRGAAPPALPPARAMEGRLPRACGHLAPARQLATGTPVLQRHR